MPVVLEEQQFETWMRGAPDEAAGLMVSYAGEIDAWEVTSAVGNPANNRPELLQRVAMF